MFPLQIWMTSVEPLPSCGDYEPVSRCVEQTQNKSTGCAYTQIDEWLEFSDLEGCRHGTISVRCWGLGYLVTPLTPEPTPPHRPHTPWGNPDQAQDPGWPTSRRAAPAAPPPHRCRCPPPGCRRLPATAAAGPAQPQARRSEVEKNLGGLRERTPLQLVGRGVRVARKASLLGWLHSSGTLGGGHPPTSRVGDHPPTW